MLPCLTHMMSNSVAQHLQRCTPICEATCDSPENTFELHIKPRCGVYPVVLSVDFLQRLSYNMFTTINRYVQRSHCCGWSIHTVFRIMSLSEVRRPRAFMDCCSRYHQAFYEHCYDVCSRLTTWDTWRLSLFHMAFYQWRSFTEKRRIWTSYGMLIRSSRCVKSTVFGRCRTDVLTLRLKRLPGASYREQRNGHKRLQRLLGNRIPRFNPSNTAVVSLTPPHPSYPFIHFLQPIVRFPWASKRFLPVNM